MKYKIADRSFKTKDEITKTCQKIRDETAPGEYVDPVHHSFLIELFSYNDTWVAKTSKPIIGLTTMIAEQGTICFALIYADGSKVDIGYPSSIRSIPTGRQCLPQALLDYRNAARTAVQGQIRKFRDSNIGNMSNCPITGELVARQNCAVDHIPPRTFDRILFDYTKTNGINPLAVKVDSQNGTVPVIAEEQLRTEWERYHQKHAVLRLASKLGNLQISKSKLPWLELCNND